MGTCGKKCFSSLNAKIALSNASRKQNAGQQTKRREGRAYQCPQCSKALNRAVYHLTST